MATKIKQSPRVKKANGSKAVLDETQKPVKGSFYEKNKHLIGSLSSDITDLSSNKKYLEGFGRSKNAGNR